MKQPLEQTGRGVYRSSYKNAMRLTRTEINLAYHYADWEYWNSSNTVIGIMVSLSNNHTLNGKPFVDICDRFDKQRFPKWFKFTGWHPQCRCIATPISPNRKELIEYLKKVRDGEDVSNFHFTGEVTELPASFTGWMKENAERLQFMQAKGRLPYFIKENISISLNSGGAGKNIQKVSVQAQMEVSAEQSVYHRTSKQMVERAKVLQEEIDNYTPQQREMFRKIEKHYGIERGFSMSVKDADSNKANPNYLSVKGCETNCSATSAVYVLREFGFNLIAKSSVNDTHIQDFLEGKDLWHNIWKNKDSSDVEISSLVKWLVKHPNSFDGTDIKKQAYIDFYNESCKEVGTYITSVYWKSSGGHFTIIKRFSNGDLRYIEPQWNNYEGSGNELQTLENYLVESATKNLLKLHISRGVLRVDDKIIDEKYLSMFEISR